MGKKRFLPLLATLLVWVLDQASKAWVVAHIPENSVGFSLFGDFLEIWHVRNNAVAFSMGSSLDLPVKLVCFVGFPLVLLGYVAWLLFGKEGEKLAPHVRWALAVFLGGGLGNLTDRVFRRLRVVDFMANRVYGLFGMEFWPTWNLADACLVVSSILLLLFLLCGDKKAGRVR